jgi:hypothetical protein
VTASAPISLSSRFSSADGVLPTDSCSTSPRSAPPESTSVPGSILFAGQRVGLTPAEFGLALGLLALAFVAVHATFSVLR